MSKHQLTLRQKTGLLKPVYSKKNDGFTIIELIMVISVIGILAAFALPRFPNLAKGARSGSVTALVDAITDASKIAHYQQLSDGLLETPIPVEIENTVITMINGYPSANGGGIEEAINSYAGFEYTPGTPIGVFTMSESPDPDNCKVEYQEATAGIQPVVTPYTDGCE
jgi:MSHA pilin protein MshA